MRKRGGIFNMTNELGTTLSDIEAKADRKREVLSCLDNLDASLNGCYADHELKTIRKYIEEN